MKYFKWFTLLAISSTNLMAQFVDTIQFKKNPIQESIINVIYRDTSFMDLHSNGKIYKFKSGLPNGEYIAFFKEVDFKNKINTDTAMTVVIKNGEINGLLRRWDEDDRRLAEECEYVNGSKTGFRKLYFTSEDGTKWMNIEQWESNVLQQFIYTEW
jgi:antitoxin component YwqK of YwqJK toxin-antitoxin module